MSELLAPTPTGGPDFVQLLTPEGQRVEHPDYVFDAGDRDEAEVIRGFYRDMVLTRRIDTESTALQRHGELGIWAQLLGQEAAQIGSGRALRPQDYVFPTSVSTASPTAVASTRCGSSVSSAASTRVPGIRT